MLPSNKPGIQFPNGTVKKTWAFSCPRTGDDIKIEEVFQQADLKLAVLSSFMWDTEWLFSKLDISRTRFMLIMEGKEESTVSSSKFCAICLWLLVTIYICFSYYFAHLSSQKCQRT